MARLSSVTSGLTSRQVKASGVPFLDCNFLHLLANSPTALKAYLAYSEALSQGQLTPQQRALLALTIAEINGARYCLSAHYAAARKLGIDEKEIRAARRATSNDPGTRGLLRFAQVVALQRGELSDADFQACRQAGLTDSLIAEVICCVTLNIFTNYFNSVARTDVDFPLLKPGADAPVKR